MKRCPYCAEEIQDAAIFCRFCRRELRGASQDLSTGATPVRKHGRVDLRTGAACLGGWLLAEAIGIGIRVVLLGMYADAQISFESSVYVAVFVSYPVGYFIAGLVTGKTASPHRARWAGFWAGFFGASLWLNHENSIHGQVRPEAWIMIASIVTAATVGGLLTGAARQKAELAQ